MRRHFSVGLLITCAAIAASAQDGFVAKATTLTYDVFDNNGKVFVNPAPEVAGSPFFAEGWKLGSLMINTNRRFDSVQLRLNLYSEEAHFLDGNNNEMALARGYVKEVLLPANVPGGRPLRFSIGYPAVDEQDSNTFYQVLSDGKLSLLHSIRKVIATQKDEMSGEVKKEYRPYEDYYIYDGKAMQRVKRSKALVGGKEIQFKSIEVLKKAIDVYNAS
jgi:hypothetical protein